MVDRIDGLHVTAAQIAERDAWERRLKLGQCTLEEALFGMLHSGAPATQYLLERLHTAFVNYSTGELLQHGQKRPRDLAETFGTVKWDIQADRAAMLARDIFECVSELHSRHPKEHPRHLSLSRTDARARNTDTAFSVAARAFCLDESTIVAKFYDGKKRQESNLLFERAKGSE